MRFISIVFLMSALVNAHLTGQEELSPLANIAEAGTAVAVHPDGEFCAIASGTRIRIVDLRNLPNGPFPVLDRFDALQEVYDLDWGETGIIAVGEKGSVTFIDESPGPSWSLGYQLERVPPYDSADFECVVVVSQAVAVIGGKPIPNTSSQTPSLFKWSIPNAVRGSVFNTDNAFGVNCWIKTVDYAPTLDRIAAGSQNASAGAVIAIYPLSSQNPCKTAVISSQVDDIESLSFSPGEQFMLTAGSPRGTNYSGCNTRQQFGGCSLTFLDEIQSVKSQYSTGTASISFRGRPLGAIGNTSKIAFVYLDDGLEPYFSNLGGVELDLDSSNTAQLIVSSKGDVFSFDRPVLSAKNIVAGQNADLRVDFATPNGLVAFGWSKTGAGPTTVPVGSCGAITLDLSQPIKRIAPLPTASGDGVATVSAMVPLGAVGIQIWIQAIDVGTCRVTNLLPIVIS